MNQQQQQRKSYSEEFKREAVRLAWQSGNLSQVARDLDVNDSMLQRWKRQLENHDARAFPGKGNPRDEERRRAGFLGLMRQGRPG